MSTIKRKKKKHSKRKNITNSSLTPITLGLCIVSILILLCILIGIYIFVFPHHPNAGGSIFSTKSISISTDNVNPKRNNIIDQYLEEATDVQPNTDNFKISVTPVSKDNAVIHVKNTSSYFFTGELVIHKKVTLSLKSMAPNSSENFNADVSLSSDAADYSCDGKFYTLEASSLIPFPIREEALGNDQFKCYLSVNSFDEESQKELAQYYYIMDTLYNFPTATEYQLFNNTGSISYGKMIVDIPSQSVSYYQDDQLIFTESY